MTPREKAIKAMAAAIYEEPWTFCEKCNGIGQDENVCFWCLNCNGKGAVVDEENVPTAREVAETDATAALDALLAPRVVGCETCGGTGHRATFDMTESVDVARRHWPCPDCTDGRRTLPPLAVLYDELEHVGWQYAHNTDGPLANLNQAAACDDTVPAFRLSPNEDGDGLAG